MDTLTEKLGQKKESQFWLDQGYPSHHFHSPDLLPTGAWLVHFTDANPQSIVNEGFLGRSADILGLTTYFKSGTNMGSLALAYRVDKVGRNRDYGFGKYGKNAVVFQVKEAITAYHFGDEENQAIFDVKDSYNIFPVFGDRDTLTYFDNGEEIIVDRNEKGLAEILATLQK